MGILEDNFKKYLSHSSDSISLKTCVKKSFGPWNHFWLECRKVYSLGNMEQIESLKEDLGSMFKENNYQE